VVPETGQTAETNTPAAGEPTLTAAPSETPAPTQAVTPTPDLPPVQAVLGDSWTRPADGMVMVYVPAGSFLMGSSQESDPFAAESEQPPHEVALDAFWIDQTEVTNAQFAQFVADTGYVTTAEEEGDGLVALDSGTTETIAGTDWQHPEGPESDLNGLEGHPVLQVTWFDAEAYCQWAGGGLPTEAQWEYAARGNEGHLYPGGNEFDGSIVNFCDASCIFSWMNLDFNDGFVRTAPVGSYPAGASWVNALDLGGNAWEWVADYYDPGYYANSPTLNPTGPETGEIKVLRGGSWFDDMSHVRYVRRGVGNPLSRHNLFGFRCAVPVQ
jgi:serine/threonine-protein kinase